MPASLHGPFASAGWSQTPPSSVLARLQQPTIWRGSHLQRHWEVEVVVYRRQFDHQNALAYREEAANEFEASPWMAGLWAEAKEHVLCSWVYQYRITK
jgi:hypothetical protein